MYAKYIKRVLDIVLSAIALVVLSPIYLILAVLVRIFMGSPVLFSQERIGKDGKTFRLYKFRSMTNEKDADGNLLDEKKRLTRFGIALRSSSLDELPEIWQIFTGKMSIVGPRPQPTFYMPYYLPHEKEIFKVRGGLLPPDALCKEAQCSWEEQFKWELYYADNVSFLLDLKILFYTFVILGKRILRNYGADDRPMLHVYRAEQAAVPQGGSENE